MLNDYPDLMTVKDLQKALQIGRSKAYSLVNTGAVRSLHIGNAIRVPKKCAIDYIDGQCTQKIAAEEYSRPFREVM